MNRRARQALVVACVAALVSVILETTPASAATAITPTVFTDDATRNGNCTLREAIRAANTDRAEDACPAGSGADTIQLQAGTYSLTVEGDGEGDGATGDLDVRADLTINGAGPGATVIDGAWPADPDRLIDVPVPGTSVTITGLTAQGGGSPDQGGALFARQGTTVTVTDSVLASNAAQFGGALVNRGTLFLTRVQVIGNTASDCCAGVENESIATLSDVLIANNVTPGGDGGYFGADSSTLTNVTSVGNSAARYGAGISIDGAATLTNVTVSGNAMQDVGSGGVDIDTGPATLNNVTITGNTVDSDNDGIGDGGGLFVESGAPVTLQNTIVAGNVDRGGQAPDCAQETGAGLTSGGHNLIGTTAGCDFIPGPGDLTEVDPLLGPLSDSGGLTSTHGLLPGSPAIDAGDPSPPGSGGTSCAVADQRGLPRGCDIGSYELYLCGTVPVNRIGTPGDDTMIGTRGADGFLGGAGNDTATGLGGDDAFCLGRGRDTAVGNAGSDQVLGGRGNDTVWGGPGNDLLKDEQGRDRLYGGTGRDRLVGGGGKDQLRCGPGRKDTVKGRRRDAIRKCEKGKP